jgi:hypothetical protein
MSLVQGRSLAHPCPCSVIAVVFALEMDRETCETRAACLNGWRRLRQWSSCGHWSGVMLAVVLGGCSSATMAAERHWDGLNPFSQPVATTDYYGSGDVDLDGAVTERDLEALRRITSGKRKANVRADINGDGVVDEEDIQLLELGLSGGVLPGWWNRLTSAGDRRDWVRRMLARDPGDKHPYTPAWQQCLGYSTQLFLRFASYQGELFATDFGAAQTVYNLPIYCVSVHSPTVAHAVNAVLIGDDPLRFEDWMIIEPQTDKELKAGARLLPFGATVTLYVPRNIQATGQSQLDRVTFQLSASGAKIMGHAPDLVLSRPAAFIEKPGNLANTWEPLLIPIGAGWLLAEKAREDLGRTADLHLIDDWMTHSPQSRPLVGDAQASRPLDVVPFSRTEFDAVWKGQPGYVPSLMHGRLDASLMTLGNRSLIAAGRSVHSARLVRVGDRLHAVWLELKLNASHAHESGLYWSAKDAGGWTVPQRLADIGQDIALWHYEELPDLRRYFFDVAVRDENELVLVWARRAALFGSVQLTERRFTSRWSESRVIAELPLPTSGVDLISGKAGEVHLAYWTGPFQQVGEEGRGPLFHRILSAQGWSEARAVDPEGNAFCPKLIIAPEGILAVVYDKSVNGSPQTAWSEWKNGSWTEPSLLPGRPGFSIRYPTAVALENDLVLVSWAERSPTRAGFGCQYLRFSSLSDRAQVVPFLRIRPAPAPALAWSAVPGRKYTLLRKDKLDGSAWITEFQGVVADESVWVLDSVTETDASSQFFQIRAE